MAITEELGRMYPGPRAVPVPAGIPVQVISVSTEVTHPPAAEAVDLPPLTQETKSFPVRKPFILSHAET